MPWLEVNLLSITKSIAKHGVQFTVFYRYFLSSIFGTQIMFDKEIQHGTRKLFAIYIEPPKLQISIFNLVFPHVSLHYGTLPQCNFKANSKITNI
jgi:hypothetical protein